MSRQLAKYWISADEYERMWEAGISTEDARLELIEGEIFETSPIGSPHAACVDFLALTLSELSRRSFIVRVQSPIRLNDFSEPRPDSAVLKWRDDFYRGAHPRPEDVLLVIEVADTTVESDRAVKAPLYAGNAIPEVWLVNLREEEVEIYDDPSGGEYRNVRHARRGEEAQSRAVADLAVSVSCLLG